MGISSGISQDEGCFQNVWPQHARIFFIFLAKKINYIGSGPGVINPDEKNQSQNYDFSLNRQFCWR